MGPMVAAARFLDLMRASPFTFAGVKARLHGSLAFTGVGHGTDRATILGLAGFDPETYDNERAEAALDQIRATNTITVTGLPVLKFDLKNDMQFDFGPNLPLHANGMVLMATDSQGDVVLQETYYSVGGGFVLSEAEMDAPPADTRVHGVPYPFKTAQEMLQMAETSGKSIAQMKRENELSQIEHDTLSSGLSRIWQVMSDCIDRGLARDGILPGGLNVRRRAKGIHDALIAERGMNLAPPHTINDWMSVYAMAVNEENAAGGQVVTAPTNGAAGVLPAVLRYYLDHVPGATSQRIEDFLLTAAAIGGLVKSNASISGAEAGCQAEVGSASAMAAAGLCAALGGSAAQIENAAEIALEHHLGMTCDPVKGL
ncbi:MAG: L-serine ammonia-lyase, partial [Paracoccaceae bacterium]